MGKSAHKVLDASRPLAIAHGAGVLLFALLQRLMLGAFLLTLSGGAIIARIFGDGPRSGSTPVDAPAPAPVHASKFTADTHYNASCEAETPETPLVRIAGIRSLLTCDTGAGTGDHGQAQEGPTEARPPARPPASRLLDIALEPVVLALGSSSGPTDVTPCDSPKALFPAVAGPTPGTPPPPHPAPTAAASRTTNPADEAAPCGEGPPSPPPVSRNLEAMLLTAASHTCTATPGPAAATAADAGVDDTDIGVPPDTAVVAAAAAATTTITTIPTTAATVAALADASAEDVELHEESPLQGRTATALSGVAAATASDDLISVMLQDQQPQRQHDTTALTSPAAIRGGDSLEAGQRPPGTGEAAAPAAIDVAASKCACPFVGASTGAEDSADAGMAVPGVTGTGQPDDTTAPEGAPSAPLAQRSPVQSTGSSKVLGSRAGVRGASTKGQPATSTPPMKGVSAGPVKTPQRPTSSSSVAAVSLPGTKKVAAGRSGTSAVAAKPSNGHAAAPVALLLPTEVEAVAVIAVASPTSGSVPRYLQPTSASLSRRQSLQGGGASSRSPVGAAANGAALLQHPHSVQLPAAVLSPGSGGGGGSGLQSPAAQRRGGSQSHPLGRSTSVRANGNGSGSGAGGLWGQVDNSCDAVAAAALVGLADGRT